MRHVLFYAFSGISILSAAGVIFFSKPSRALLSLIVTMFSLAVLFILLGAYFVAMAHLIVYAGAVLVLFLFVIMLQGIGARDIPVRERFHGFYFFWAALAGASLLGATLFISLSSPLGQPRGIEGTVENFGSALFKDYLLPFELTSVLLLLGVFAAVALAKKDKA